MSGLEITALGFTGLQSAADLTFNNKPSPYRAFNTLDWVTFARVELEHYLCQLTLFPSKTLLTALPH